jgi:hypothetical protein
MAPGHCVKDGINYYADMKIINTLFTPMLKAVAALANNGGIFHKRKKAAFNPKISLGFNF